MKASYLENTKLNVEIRKLNDKNSDLKDSNNALNRENEDLKKVGKYGMKESKATEESIQKINDIQASKLKLLEENCALKKDLKKIKDLERERLDKKDEQIKLKEMEIKSLFLTRKSQCGQCYKVTENKSKS